jgi:lysyl-tRNA synthetase class I
MALDKDDIKQLIAILQKGLVDDESPDVDESPVPQKTNKRKAKKANLFDKMTEANMHKDDVEIDRRLRKFPPTERSRSYTPANVKCRVCGKQESVNPSLVESIERYKCNKCCTSAG